MVFLRAWTGGRTWKPACCMNTAMGAGTGASRAAWGDGVTGGGDGAFYQRGTVRRRTLRTRLNRTQTVQMGAMGPVSGRFCQAQIRA